MLRERIPRCTPQRREGLATRDSSVGVHAAHHTPGPRDVGGHVEACDRCGHTRVWYNSCRNRHCSSCQSLARARWVAARTAEMLDCEYFHVVYTVPKVIAAIALQNPAVVYGILFRATAETLRTIAADPEHLGAEIGFIAVLHTWDQTLGLHPHLHCVVPGGGLSRDGTHWVACRPGFFMPVRVLVPAVPPPLSPVPRGSLRREAAALRRGTERPARASRVRRAPRTRAQNRVGRVRQAPVRRLATGARLRRSLHAPRCHLRRSTARSRGRPRPVQVRNSRRNAPPSPRQRSARQSSSGGSCCTCCRPASTALATTACSAIATGPRSWPAAGNCSAWHRRARPPRRPTTAISMKRLPRSRCARARSAATDT